MPNLNVGLLRNRMKQNNWENEERDLSDRKKRGVELEMLQRNYLDTLKGKKRILKRRET